MANQNYKTLKAQLEDLRERTEAARVAEISAVIDQIRSLVVEYDLTPEQVFGRKRIGAAGTAKPKAEVSAKYHNPKTGETWSGRGRAPAWIKNVKNRDRFLIAQ